MIPLRDNIPSRSTPIVNYALIVACSLVFLLQLSEAPDQPSLIERYGMVPARVVEPDQPLTVPRFEQVRTPFGWQVLKTEHPMAPAAVPTWMTLLTCVFLHGGWMHFIGNMWVLWIFGDNVEDRYGHVGYLIFYLACGVAASAAHFLVDRSSTVPTIGASGAIAGVMGAYFLMYRRARVLCIVPIFFFLQIIWLPAPIFLGVWFLVQFFQGTASITSMQSGGVAWWAHIGGFLAGLAVTLWLRNHQHLKPAVQARRPGSERVVYVRPRSGSPWH
ncbi:MAG: rhomboid family intramembrane serine protease [Planctomycetota bacterium]|jgi:membrane associated rhomboid family serine protease